MSRYTLAAYLSIAAGLLSIPLLFIAAGVGALEGLTDSRGPGLLLNGFALLSYLLHLFVYIVLGHHLRSARIRWPIRALIVLSCLGIVLLVVESLMPSLEYLFAIIHLGEAVLYAIALLALSIRLLRARARCPSVEPLHAFALCEILTGVLMLTVILLPLAYITGVLGDFLLAGAFFKIRGAGREHPPDATRRALHAADLWLLMGLSLCLLALLPLHFGSVYELPWADHARDGWLEGLIAVFLAGQSVALGLLLRGRFGLHNVARALNWWAAAGGLFVCHLLARDFLVESFGPGLRKVLTGVLLTTGVPWLLSIVSGGAVLYVSLSLAARQAELNGYRQPLLIGLFTLSVGYLLVFPDTLRMVGTLLTSLAAIGLVLSLWTQSRTSAFVLNTPRRIVLVGLALVLPTGVYVGFHTVSEGPLRAMGSVIAQLVTTEITEMERVDAGGAPTVFVPSKTELVHAHPVLNDVWFVDGIQAYGVDGQYLYRTQDAGATWQRLRRLLHPGEVVRFGTAGTRGWAGSSHGPAELTADGGATWRTLDPAEIFRNQVGREYGTKLSDFRSVLHLDPDSGRGAFVMGCRYFTSQDFGQTWQMLRFEKAEGKGLCIAESPLAVNEAQTLVIGRGLSYEFLYRRNSVDAPWKLACALDEDAVLFVDTPMCREYAALSEQERRFVERYDRDTALSYPTPVPSEIKTALLSGQEPPEDSLQWFVRRSAAGMWLVEHGFLAHKGRGAQNWTVAHHIPNLVQVIPVDETHAAGWDGDLQVYTSQDGGKVWRPLALVNETTSDDYVRNIRAAPDNKGLWLAYNQSLHFFPFGHDSTQLSLNLGPQGDFSRFGTSADGKRLWLYDETTRKVHVSRDRGESWQAVNLHEHDVDGDYELTLSDAACDDVDRCYLLFGNGAITELEFVTGALRYTHRTVATIPEERDYGGGHLVVNAEGSAFVYIEAEGSAAHRSLNRGKTWRRLSLGARDYWSAPEHFGGADSYLLPGADKAVIIKGFDGDRLTINPSGWDEGISLCGDTEGGTLYAFNDENLAVSVDGGKSWRRNDQELAHPPFCGIYNDVLWLKHHEMQVHVLHRR